MLKGFRRWWLRGYPMDWPLDPGLGVIRAGVPGVIGTGSGSKIPRIATVIDSDGPIPSRTCLARGENH